MVRAIQGNNMKTLQVLGALLTYPTPQFMEVLEQLPPLLEQETWLKSKPLKAVQATLQEFQSKDLLELQEEYVELFDRTPSLSLHLFEHIHGDSKDRGQAMVDLSNMYQEQNLEINVNETPDYLPMFLEYLSTLHGEEAQECLAETVTVLKVLQQRLEKRQSSYANIFAALISLTKSTPDEKVLAEMLKAADGRVQTEAEIDAAWEEQMAFDTSAMQAGSCGNSTPPTGKVKVILEKGN